MKYLGIDYGEKRVGIAMSDDNGEMAFPKLVLQNDRKFIENLKKLILENKVKKVVIGDSKNYKLIDNDIMVGILDLKSVLEVETEIDVVLHSEILSSMEAERIQGKNDMLDASAATIILQSYLDLQKHLKNLNK